MKTTTGETYTWTVVTDNECTSTAKCNCSWQVVIALHWTIELNLPIGPVFQNYPQQPWWTQLHLNLKQFGDVTFDVPSFCKARQWDSMWQKIIANS